LILKLKKSPKKKLEIKNITNKNKLASRQLAHKIKKAVPSLPAACLKNNL